jgi:hypothetical protein
MTGGTEMTERVKFAQVSRVICPKTGFITWMRLIRMVFTGWLKWKLMWKKWITYKEIWYQDPQQPLDL